MAKYGNTGVSSLLSAAKSAAEKTAAYNDSIAGYEWDISARTPEDFAKYRGYLATRAKTITDPAKSLTLQKAGTSAYRSFNSAEISRETDSVNLGEASNRDKYQVLTQLYQRALENGDDYLAQSIAQRADSLSVTIQREEQAADERSAKSGAASYAKSFESYLKDNVDKPLNELEAALTKGEITPAQYYDRKNQKLEEKQVLYQKAIDSGALSEAKSQSYQDKLEAAATDTKAIKEAGYLGQAAQANPSRMLSYDTNSQTYNIADRQVVGHTPEGAPIYRQSGAEGSKLVRQSLTAGQVAGDATQVNAIDGLVDMKDHPGYSYAVDPRTGKTLYLNKAQDTYSTTQAGQEGTYVAGANDKSVETGGAFGGHYRFDDQNSAASEVAARLDLGGIKDRAGNVLTHTASAIAGSPLNPLSSVYNTVTGVLDMANAGKKTVDAAAAAERMRQAQADILAKNAASTRALAAIPAANKAVPVTFSPTTGRVQNAPQVYRVPAAVVAAQNTPGTQDFTKKYLPSVGKLGF